MASSTARSRRLGAGAACFRLVGRQREGDRGVRGAAVELGALAAKGVAAVGVLRPPDLAGELVDLLLEVGDLRALGEDPAEVREPDDCGLDAGDRDADRSAEAPSADWVPYWTDWT